MRKMAVQREPKWCSEGRKAFFDVRGTRWGCRCGCWRKLTSSHVSLFPDPGIHYISVTKAYTGAIVSYIELANDFAVNWNIQNNAKDACN